MRCHACQAENRGGTAFCEQCGVRLAPDCGACGSPMGPSARFCGSCGAPAAASDAQSAADPQRRLVTVVFCDLVESTRVADRLDPEDFHSLIRAFHTTCAAAVEDGGGHLAQYLGDGVLAYFGYPVARERDAQAAVRTGLAIAREVPALATQSEGLQVRVGIHTGLVVTGEMGSGAQKADLAVGSAVNIAARLQGLAAPNRVVVSEATRRLARGSFAFEAQGAHALKGISAPVVVYEVAEAGRDTAAASTWARVAPLVGRERERDEVRALARRAEAGHGQTLLVCGEAGIGKSRLLRELEAAATERGHTFLECRCSPHHEGSPLYPAIELLQRAWTLGPLEPADVRIARLREAVATSTSGSDDALPLLAALLGVPLPGAAPPDSPERRRERTLELLAEILASIAREGPVVLAVEDLHWIDPTSLELVERLVARIPEHALLLCLTARPSFAAPFADADAVTRLDLRRLGDADTAQLMASVAGGKTLPPEVTVQLASKAEGIPLYVEELTRTMLESGQLEERGDRFALNAPHGELEIPVTLQESLMARLDRLAPIKEVLQLGAVIGRSFSHELLCAVAKLDEGALRDEIAWLLEADVLRVEGVPPDTVYVFKHALIQDAAYEALLRSRRRVYHRRVAEVLEAEFPHVGATQPEILARHWAEAGESLRAVECYARAGRASLERSANAEAADQLGRALALIEGLDAGPERDRLELETRIPLGTALVAVLGFTAEEVEQVYARARVLCADVGDPVQHYDALSGLFLFHQARAELATALDLTRERLRVAESLGDDGLVTMVHENLGTLAFWRGEFAEALASIETALARYEPRRAREIALVYGTESSVVCETYAAQILWFLGRPDAARRRCEEAVARARAIGHANSLGLALSFAASMYHTLGDPETTRAYADEALAFATEQRLRFWVGFATIYQGCAQIAAGRPDAGIDTMTNGIAGHQAVGSRLGGALCLAFLADGHRAAGRADEALGVLTGGLGLLGNYEDRFYDAEIERTKGELLAQQGDIAAAERCLQDALALARRQGARGLELRAASSRVSVRLRSGGDAPAAARELAAVYATFDEGLGLPDLKQAGALLAEASPPRV